MILVNTDEMMYFKDFESLKDTYPNAYNVPDKYPCYGWFICTNYDGNGIGRPVLGYVYPESNFDGITINNAVFL
jgi:hypothetical protein